MIQLTRTPPRHDWRAGPASARRLLFAATRSLAGTTRDPGAAVLARVDVRGRTLEVTTVGMDDVVGHLAPIAARFGYALLVRHVERLEESRLRRALARGAILLAGTPSVAGPAGSYAGAPA